MTRRAFAGLLPLALIAAVCSDRPIERVEVLIRVRGDGGAPVPGASVSIDRRTFAETDALGEARGLLRLDSGVAHRVSHTCPVGMRAVEPESGLRLQALVPLGGGPGSLSPISVERHCAALELAHVLLVRTGGRAGLPIRILGRQAGSTDEDGVAMLVVRGAPGDEIEISIDTSATQELRPSSPSRRLELPNGRRFFVFDQSFEERAKRRERAKRPRKMPKRL